jgi:hypothetical protein
MLVDHYVRVRCVNEKCARPADTKIAVEIVASGVVGILPPLKCQSCRHHLRSEEVTGG